MEKGQYFQQIVLEKLGVHIQKHEPRCNFTSFTKINSTRILDLSIKCKAIQLLEEKWEKILVTLCLVMRF